jgi:hypothetical protein
MFRTKSLIVFLFFAATIVLNSCYYDNEEELYGTQQQCDTTNVTYSGFVAPLMTASCNGCHSGAGAAAGIATDSYTNVIANLERIQGAINHSQEYSPMPQNGSKLGNCELSKFAAWINAGKPNN